jgi:hypothetical protein
MATALDRWDEEGGAQDVGVHTRDVRASLVAHDDPVRRQRARATIGRLEEAMRTLVG